MKHTPREWAKLTVYGALKNYRGDPKREDITSRWITMTIQRLADDERGELLDGVGMVDKIKRLLNPDQGADLEDMGEWAEWIIESFLPSASNYNRGKEVL